MKKKEIKSLIKSIFQFIPGLEVVDVRKDKLNKGVIQCTIMLPKLEPLPPPVVDASKLPRRYWKCSNCVSYNTMFLQLVDGIVQFECYDCGRTFGSKLKGKKKHGKI